MNKERIYVSVASAIVLIVITIPLWWTTIHDIEQHLDLAIRMIPKEVIGVAGMVEAQFMLVRQDIWLLFFFGLVGWYLFLWREIGRH